MTTEAKIQLTSSELGTLWMEEPPQMEDRNQLIK